MHGPIHALAAMIASSIVASTQPQTNEVAPLRIGAPLPHFYVDALDGAKVSSDRFHGRPLVINFFATWCRPCRFELPRIEQAAVGRQAIAFLGIDEAEPPDAVSSFARTMGLTYEITIDQGLVAAGFAVRVMPESVFVDRFGVVRAINAGYLSAESLGQDLGLISGH
jgi:cytochrome c biogenesis protein CcmG, thiol:disulfide interchange protein DsbE